ncbi:alkaline phosphatase [Wenyingzhuangia sp. 2_MG-2023]|uniref:alkaline phosphatase n=1 Tax=Wenyingzhuangia sp. 2_MG-2023 TaxID=3062639 RepID=UPI0026E1950B|nr:alkaline phosphatase [Wenyingzhuangia sp. 2_MG-2023]MDO6736706.1 alkaline phosphatase [Wenyingzhuangia sp. 2_MG-2023]
MLLIAKRKLSILFFSFLISIGFAQNHDEIIIQSHNDYKQKTPFWTAYTSGLNLIEADVFLKKGKLYVAHENGEIEKHKTLEALYLKPLLQVSSKDEDLHKDIILMIDVKTEAVSTLTKIQETLQNYPQIINHKHIKIVISGNRPNSDVYHTYPAYISFDYQEIEEPIAPENLEKVALVSTSFNQYSEWNGKGRLTHHDYEKVTNVIHKGKKLHKPFRFWGTPDSKTAWRIFTELGVDVINTDMPKRCAEYVHSLVHRTTKPLVVSKVYQPTFKNDGAQTQVKNVVLLIGDGNGLSQISSATLANKGVLTLTQLKKIGLIKTQSADDFTTDSAAAGTALATGQKTNNRAIGTDVNGDPLKNITELLHQKGFSTGCITTDEITGATPSSFYAHQKDRSQKEEIAEDLLTSDLDFFAGGGAKTFKKLEIKKQFSIVNHVDELTNSKAKRAGLFFSKGGVPSIITNRGNLLAETTKAGLQFLKQKEKPFFLMVEAAQIDSFGHSNNTEGIVNEGVDFDRAITEAIKFADENEGTLVIVTADHETSGFSVSSGDVQEHKIEGGFVSHDHTGTMVPIFAYGPQSDNFSGVYENNLVFKKIVEVLK